jgi:hypothetical protein
MAKIVKKVDRIIPSAQRTQTFTQADMSSGDIIDIKTTLGRPAKSAQLTHSASGGLSLKRNVLHKLYPTRLVDPHSGIESGMYLNLSLEQEVIDDTVVAESDHTDAHTNETIEGPLTSLEITWTSGTWQLTVW